MVQSGKKCSSLIFWKHGAVNEFYGSIDISSQMRGGRVSRYLRSRKAQVVTHGNLYVNKHATCDFKSPLLLQFPYCELCDNDNKQSNYRLMNVLCRTKAISADFSKSSK